MNTKIIDISKSSLLSLKAEVLRKQEEVNKAKLSSKAQFIQALSRPKNKTSIFDKKNSDVDNRDKKDIDPEEEDLLRKSRRVLEAKSKLYDRLSKQANILTEDDDNSEKSQYLVQFSKKPREKNESSDDDTHDYDEYDKNVDPEDDWVEYVDCLGRTRKCLRRDLSFIKEKDRLLDESLPLSRKVPKEHDSKYEKEVCVSNEETKDPDADFDDKNELLSNDMKRELMRQEWEKQEELLRNKTDIHYQDILFSEARSHGVGYFSFSQDEEERIRQQQELKKLRDETKQKQNIVEEKRLMRQKQFAAREKAARNRKRARMGLPPEEDEPEPEERPVIPEKSQEELGKEIEKENFEKEKEAARKRIVRPWDIGKDGIRREIKTQEEWVQEKRSERPKDFAPPSVYKTERKKLPITESTEESNSLYFTTKKNKQTHNWRQDLIETVNNNKTVIEETQNQPFWIDTSIPPPNLVPIPVLYNSKSINPYKNSSLQNMDITDKATTKSETNDAESSSRGFQNTFKPVPIVNECEDAEDENINNKGSEKYSIDDLSDTSSSDDQIITKKGTEIPPPSTFEYYGPSDVKKCKYTQPMEQIKSSVEAGLKFLRQQAEKKKARTENVGFFELFHKLTLLLDPTMAPVPLEGLQTPVANSIAQGGLSGPQEGNRGGSISLAVLIDFIVQRTYHELTVLAELLPRKTDMERKIEIYNFSARTRQLFVRLLALVKWASSASKVEKSARIMAFLDKQSLLFIETADMLARMARETLVHARLPNFHIPAAVEVLTTGTYARLPACIREKIVPPDPITPVEKRETLLKLNQVIQHRLVTGNLLPQMRNLKIENGRVTFHVQHEFEVSLTVMGDGPNIPWRLLDIDILVEDKETGDGKALVHSLQVQYIHQVLQARLADNPNPLTEVYNFLHFFCQALQLEVLYTQTLRLIRDRLEDHIHVDDYTPGKCLMISYWRELTSKDPRSELGYRLTVQVDNHDPARPLAVVHVPSLGNKESEIADRAIRSELLSLERLLVHTIYVRTKNRLGELKTELEAMLKDVECQLQGSPAILSVAVLQPCLRAEQLLITVGTHTGMLQCHVPQYDVPLMGELHTALNGDHSRLPTLISELRFWITQRRCEKTLQHLPATPHERLPLLHHPDHPVTKIGRHRMYVQLHRHPNVILIVDLKEKESSPCEMECSFYLAVVKHSSIEDNPHDDSIETEIPKMYLRVLTLLQFDTFVVTHGPFTSVDADVEQDQHTSTADSGVNGANSSNSSGTPVFMDYSHLLTVGVKRKLPPGSKESPSRKCKSPAYFIPELAHVVAMCDERLSFISLGHELTKRDIYHQGLQIEANATALVLRLLQLPPPTPEMGKTPAWNALLKRLLSAAIRAQGKHSPKLWVTEFVFYSSPLASTNPKEQGMRRPVYFQYDVGPSDTVSRTVDALLSDWSQIVHLYSLVHDFAEYYSIDQYNFHNIVTVKSYNYNTLLLSYGPERGTTVSVSWCPTEHMFKLVFTASQGSVNAHQLMKEQLEVYLNRTHNLAQLVHILHETYEPLVSVSKLPTLPQMGVHNTRPQVPVQTFTIMAQSATMLRLAYQGMYCLELRLLGGGLVSLRDGAYSRFDRSNVVEEFTPTQGLKTFLSKYADETAISRRRSQSEDDNPPSPITMETEAGAGGSGFMSHHRGPQSPAQQRDALRFHPPLTPPSGSNPHTPASPHANITQGNTHTSFGSSPATSFNLASPPSLPPNINPSPVPLLPHPSPSGVASSPLNPLHVPSPAGLMPSASPGPSLPGHSPASSFMQTGHTDGSPFPSSQSMTSPAASNWPGSPSVPRPSPARPGQSPLGHAALHSPQADHKSGSHSSRVLPARPWAAAVPTLLTNEALDRLCRPSPHPSGLPGPELAPIERFLGCVYMRRQLQRYIQTELTALTCTEPGVVHFKVDTLQCRVGLNPQHLQSLHIKITPLPDHKDQWTTEELQIIEKFFDTRAAAPPYKPNSLSGFGALLNVPFSALKDFVQIMRLEVIPGLVQQQCMKWSVQWALRIPPSASPIAPCGTAAVLVLRTKILFFLQITRIGVQYPNNIEPPTLVLPLVYDASTNLTQLAEKREPGPAGAMGAARRDPPASALTAASHQLKRFADFGVNPNECSLYPAVRDLLMNLVLPSEPPQMQNQVVPSPAPGGMTPTQQIQSPAMQMNSPMPPQAQGQQGYPVGMTMGMMGPQ